MKLLITQKNLCSLGNNICVSAASLLLCQQASLGSREFTSNAETERAIDSADLLEGVSPFDAFDDDPSLLGTAPAVKRFPAWQ